MPGVRLIWSLFQRSTPSKVTDPAPSGRSIDLALLQVDAEHRAVGLGHLGGFDLSSS